jgi:protein-arginine kinase activator protein McsA
MSLILDHVNGDRRDNRLENLQVVCPNCAATLDTHCGMNPARIRQCAECGATFKARRLTQAFCSAQCGRLSPANRAAAIRSRKVERPAYIELLTEVRSASIAAVARRLGVTESAVRQWLRRYRAEAEAEAA